MTVQDIISITDESTVVNVWRDGEIIATYDGMDTVPKELREKPVKGISAGNFNIGIDI